jgi:uncharacterized protein YdhG (YjbR/CyaY superfamily)
LAALPIFSGKSDKIKGMAVKKTKPSSIEEYVDTAPIEVQEKLRQMHDCIREAAPGAIQSLKWGMPAYSYKKILVTFALFKHHIGFYPMPSAVKAFAVALTKYKTASGSIQFPLEKNLPLALIRKIVRFRVKESNDGVIKWKS